MGQGDCSRMLTSHVLRPFLILLVPNQREVSTVVSPQQSLYTGPRKVEGVLSSRVPRAQNRTFNPFSSPRLFIKGGVVHTPSVPVIAEGFCVAKSYGLGFRVLGFKV